MEQYRKDAALAIAPFVLTVRSIVIVIVIIVAKNKNIAAGIITTITRTFVYLTK